MRFNSVFAVSAISLCLAATPVLADPEGFVSGGIGGNNLSAFDQSSNAPLLQGRGSATVMLTPTLTMQGDVVLQYQRYTQDFLTQSVYHVDGALHLSYRDSEQFLAGAFIQLGNEKVVINDFELPNSPRLFLGAEAQAYLGEVTLYGQIGAARVNFFEEAQMSGFFATGEVRYFLTPDFKVDVHGSVISLAYEADNDVASHNYGIGVGAEYRLSDSPISLFGSLDYFREDFTDGTLSGQIDNTRILVGMKFNFGTDTLQSRDRNGSTLNPVAQVPLFFPVFP